MGGHTYKGPAPGFVRGEDMRKLMLAILDAWDCQQSAAVRSAKLELAIYRMREAMGVARPKANGLSVRTKTYPTSL